MCSKQQDSPFFPLLRIVTIQQLLRFIEYLHHQLTLHPYQTVNTRLIFVEHLIVPFRYRTGNNQRRTGIVDQHRVNLIHNRIIVFTLYQILGMNRHVIAQIIETEFVIRTESNIRHISLTAFRRIRLMLINTIHRQTVEHIQRSHPLRVTLCQIIIHRHHMHSAPRQCIQKYR